MVSLNRSYHFIFFKGCLPQILLGSLLNTLPHISVCKHLTYVHLSKETWDAISSALSFRLISYLKMLYTSQGTEFVLNYQY